MKLKDIVDALNGYYLKKFPNARGWFIGKESLESSLVNAYKKYKVEIFYHTPGKNHIAFTQQFVDRLIDIDEEAFKTKFFVTLLKQIFISLTDLDKYETL